MNNLMVLTFLCAAALVGVVAYSLGSVKNTPSAEDEKRKLRQEIEMLSLNDVHSAPRPEPKIDEDKERIARLEAELAEHNAAMQAAQEEELRRAEEAALAAETPEPTTIDPREDEQIQRHMRKVMKATQMASVLEYVRNDEFDFVSLQVLNSNNVFQGARLAIRRGGKIIGQVEVDNVTGSSASASVIPESFLGGQIDVRAGDELIISF